jgi:hypothetical protein
MCKLTPVGKLKNLGFPFRLGHLFELVCVRAQGGKWLCTGRGRVDQERASKTVVKLAAVV